MILSISLVFVFIIGCSNSKPDATVEKYFTVAQKLDFESVVATIVPSETKSVDEAKDSFTGEEDNYSKYFIDYLKKNAEKITYKITDSKVEGDNAVVTVETKYINAGPIIKASLGELFAKGIAVSFSGVEMTEEETNQIFDSIIKEQVETIEETYTGTHERRVKLGRKWSR